ncbi:MAG: class I SAM-dependent methyltransferase [Bacteroidetes bacterium]|nr:class I SAM-dependent methyltransferase [Bacteroidota bacterium]
MSDKFIGKWAFPIDDSLLEQSARRGEQYDFEKIAKDIIGKVHFESHDVVLDLCCGNAALAKIISKTCKEIHGVDFSEKLIETAKIPPASQSGKIFLPSRELAVVLHLSDALNIDKLFQEDFFDKSYCYFSFQYFDKKKREDILEKLSRVTKHNGVIFLGDIPDKTRMWNFYPTQLKFYREKISRLIQFKEGECDLGWWINPKEIIDWCERKKLPVTILQQEKTLPHAHYRFDVLIKNSK